MRHSKQQWERVTGENLDTKKEARQEANQTVLITFKCEQKFNPASTGNTKITRPIPLTTKRTRSMAQPERAKCE